MRHLEVRTHASSMFVDDQRMLQGCLRPGAARRPLSTCDLDKQVWWEIKFCRFAEKRKQLNRFRHSPTAVRENLCWCILRLTRPSGSGLAEADDGGAKEPLPFAWKSEYQTFVQCLPPRQCAKLQSPLHIRASLDIDESDS